MKKENGKISAEIIIIIAVILVVIGVVAYTVLGKKAPLEYYVGKATSDTENVLIDNNKKILKLISSNKLEDIIQNKVTFDKVNVRDRYNEEYFTNKKVALVVCYEDDSQFCEYSINSLTYNEDKTEATIRFTDKREGYLGTLTKAWYNYLFIELEGTVENVNFIEE